MQFKIEEVINTEVTKKSSVSVPNSLQANKIFVKDIEVDRVYYSGDSNSFVEVWQQQHPLIHTWLVLSPISICFLFALLFIIH